MTPETKQILPGPGYQSWYKYNKYCLETAETINQTHVIKVDDIKVLLREHRIIFNPFNYFLSIADYQIYVHGTIEKEEIVPSLQGIIYIVRPIGDRTELADKIACLVRELFPDFAGELSFDSRDI